LRTAAVRGQQENQKLPTDYAVKNHVQYKTLTGIMASRISTHLEEQNLLPAEQKGCHPGRNGGKD